MAWDESGIRGEHADWYRNHDPILIYARKLLKEGSATRDEIVALDNDVNARMAAARKFAVESPLPPAETALDHVFA
jgi:pyruvate dehydrogenase E1 component alpha subunit